jgi:hypothetical protein
MLAWPVAMLQLFRGVALKRDVDALWIDLHCSSACRLCPEKQGVLVRTRNIAQQLIIFLSATRKPFDAIGCVAASGSDFARTSLLIPCYREITSLLSRINSLFCLLGNFFRKWLDSRCFRDGFS